jgi:putative addiction module killer protein
MRTVLRTDDFAEWLIGLRDARAKAMIAARIDRIAHGNLGDVARVGEGVSEARIHYGPGYRLYFVERAGAIIILLCGGDKSSQSRDIARAQLLSKEV